MKHLFANKQRTSLVNEFSETIKNDREAIVGAVEDIPLAKDMRPANISFYIQNADHNDKERYSDSQHISFHSVGSGDFVWTIQSTIKQILNTIFDNTNDFNSFILTCNFHYVLYKGYRAKNFRNGRIFVNFSILEEVRENGEVRYFNKIRHYEIEIKFEEVGVIDTMQSLKVIKDALAKD